MVSGTILNLRRTPCPPDASESSRSRLYPRTETIRSQRFLLLQVVANLRDQLIGQLLFEQRPIRRRPGRRIGPKSEVFRVRGQQRIESFPGMGAPAGPSVVARLGHHPCANRIQLDVAAAGQEISTGVDHAGLVTALPQRTGA